MRWIEARRGRAERDIEEARRSLDTTSRTIERFRKQGLRTDYLEAAMTLHRSFLLSALERRQLLAGDEFADH